jgi:hypothetical protein
MARPTGVFERRGVTFSAEVRRRFFVVFVEGVFGDGALLGGFERRFHVRHDLRGGEGAFVDAGLVDAAVEVVLVAEVVPTPDLERPFARDRGAGRTRRDQVTVHVEAHVGAVEGEGEMAPDVRREFGFGFDLGLGVGTVVDFAGRDAVFSLAGPEDVSVTGFTGLLVEDRGEFTGRGRSHPGLQISSSPSWNCGPSATLMQDSSPSNS